MTDFKAIGEQLVGHYYKTIDSNVAVSLTLHSF